MCDERIKGIEEYIDTAIAKNIQHSLKMYEYGEITGKYVIYRGESSDLDGIRYVNVEEYLKAFRGIFNY